MNHAAKTKAKPSRRTDALLGLGGPKEALEAFEHVAVGAAVVQVAGFEVIDLLLHFTQLVLQPSLALRKRL